MTTHARMQACQLASIYKILSVRLPEADLRRFKSLAAAPGVSVQDAVYQALDVWAMSLGTAHSQPLAGLEGSLAEVDVEKLMRSEREAELTKDRRLS